MHPNATWLLLLSRQSSFLKTFLAPQWLFSLIDVLLASKASIHHRGCPFPCYQRPPCVHRPRFYHTTCYICKNMEALTTQPTLPGDRGSFLLYLLQRFASMPRVFRDWWHPTRTPLFPWVIRTLILQIASFSTSFDGTNCNYTCWAFKSINNRKYYNYDHFQHVKMKQHW